MAERLRRLRRSLAGRHADYLLLDNDGATAHARFVGPFEGREIVWDATVRALRGLAPPPTPFINVGADTEHGLALTVGIDVVRLDTPTLAKTVVMIRRYKRLRRGHTEFGKPAMRRCGITRIVSGGQTGVDRAALDVALALGIPCGGWCPRGRRAEDGVISPRYPLTEADTPEYPERTARNVRDSDATLILTRGVPAGGTALTQRLAEQHHKPHLLVDLSGHPDPRPICAWLVQRQVCVLNVAGTRESSAPGIHDEAMAFLRDIFSVHY